MARASLRLLLMALPIVFWGGGCGGTEEPQPAMVLSLSLGTVDVRTFGDNRWVDLTDDKQVELAPGAQGGFHVWLLYRLGDNNVGREVRVERIADRLAADGSRQRVLTTSNVITLLDEPLYETPAPIPSFMCPTPIGVNVLDAPLELKVRVTENDAAETPLAEKRVRLQPVCPPVGDGQRDFCFRICQG